MLYLFIFFIIWGTVIHSADDCYTNYPPLLRTHSAPELRSRTNHQKSTPELYPIPDIRMLQKQIIELAIGHNAILNTLGGQLQPQVEQLATEHDKMLDILYEQLQPQIEQLTTDHDEMLDMLYAQHKQIIQLTNNQKVINQTIKNDNASIQAKHNQLRRDYDQQVTLFKLELKTIKDLLTKQKNS